MDEAYRFLEWSYEPALRRLVGPAGETRLKPLPDRLLRCLLDAPGRVLSREQLIDAVWTRREVNDEVLSRAVAELRALLGDDARRPRFVETLSKGGYRWIAPVTRGEVAHATGAHVGRRWIIAVVAAALACVGLIAWHYVRRSGAGADQVDLAVGLLAARPLAADAKLEYDARFAGVGQVVYVRAERGSRASDLVLIDTASLAERVLWQSDAVLSDPAPSPDGREVAVLRHDDGSCEVWSVALVDLRRARLATCAPAGAGGLEWADGGEVLLFTGAAADASHAPGLVRFDRRTGALRVLTTPEIGEGAHINPRVSRDGARLVYASMREGEAQLWQSDWPGLAERRALLKRPEPLYGHAFELDGDGLWVAGDLTLYRALHRLVPDREPELIGGRGAIAIDIAPNGAAVWPEANYDADIWLRDRADAPWIAIARSNFYESQPAFSPDGSRIALVSNRNGVESVFVYDRRDGSVRSLPLDARLRWVRPSWSLRDESLVLTAYEARDTRLYRYRFDEAAPRLIDHIDKGAFGGVELADRLVYMTGGGTGRGTLMQLREGATAAEDTGLGTVSAFRASREFLVWRSDGTASLHAAPWPTLEPVRDIASDDDGEAFALVGNTLHFVDGNKLRVMTLPDGAPSDVVDQRVPSGNGPAVAASADGALAVVTLVSVNIDLMIAEPATATKR